LHFLIARKQSDLSSALQGNAAIAVEFDLKDNFSSMGSIVTGLHCMGSMNAGSVRSELFGASSSLFPLARYFSAHRPKKTRLINPGEFSGQFNQQHYANSQKPSQTKPSFNETRSA
jgi:hypothetical protein